MSEAKKIKLSSSAANGKAKKGKDGKRNYYARAAEAKSGRERFLRAGHRGFLITCNGRVRDCLRDSYRILNQCADELYGPAEESKDPKEKTPEGSGKDDEEEEEDISVKLQKEAEAAAQKENKTFRFQNVDSGAMNCLFIQTSLENPSEMAHKIMKDLSATKKQRSRFILRMLPIQVVCRANLTDIIDAVGALSDRYFLKEPKSFAIVFNRRLNNELSRTDLIEKVADLIASKNAGNKANLKSPDLAVIVEVIKGLCCIGVLPEYYQLRKYNLAEIVAQHAPPSAETPSVTTTDAAEDKKDQTVSKPDEAEPRVSSPTETNVPALDE